MTKQARIVIKDESVMVVEPLVRKYIEVKCRIVGMLFEPDENEEHKFEGKGNRVQGD